MLNRSMCSAWSKNQVVLPHFSTVSSIAAGPHAHAGRSRQSATMSSSLSKSSLPSSLGELKVQPVTPAAPLSISQQLVFKNHRILRSGPQCT